MPNKNNKARYAFGGNAMPLGTALVVVLCVPAFAAGNAHIGARSNVPPAGTVCKSCAEPDAVAAPTPPAGFDPVTASDGALAHYGYPPRPDAETAPNAYASWKNVMSRPARRINPVFQATNIYNRPASILSTTPGKGKGASGTTSHNWSGYAVLDSSNPFKTTNTTTYGAFVIPVAQQASGSCSGQDYSSQWVGVDG
jgi:hypothetical protein